MTERKDSMENFIAVYDGYITEQHCKEAIDLYENQVKFKKTMDRLTFENAPITEKKDTQLFLGSENINVWHTKLDNIMNNFDIALRNYLRKISAESAFGVKGFHYTGLKLQKTLPTEGYHIWHVEHSIGYENEPRAFVYSIYLNDVEEGGETEFLHFSKRVKPKTGRIVIWPASFPYLHRGNPPLSGEKYILTSWINLRSVN